MLGWLESIAGPNYAPAILWTLAALVFLVVILLIVKLIRSLTFGTYVAGGRNRKTRLAVMDATAVDSHRRLVLVRRDDIEHLILIGGPTDVVVERDIRMVPSRRPVLTGDGQPQAAAPAPARQQQRPAQPAPAPQPVRQEPPRQQANHVSHREPVAPAAAPRVQPQPAAQPAPRAEPVRAETALRTPPPPVTDDLLDDALMQELEVSLEEDALPPAKSGAKASPSLDDEMAKLLGELSNHKR
ncbi:MULTISPECIES: flagellar biosynthetic protein FliO [Phyllobacteriaceae]|uniref:Flagellar biosynthesis protein FliO n=1 Tax=Mesorhizobium hungaricum TaxID=1566387 RepID=A0A1C2DSY5_9HYPH|nr:MULTISPECIES: flagellar biosynthetic protein FliO [Mesorhizobium]MBN9235940.1 flagellar biosynthetic protein FliO [Mesorhizobium sp.]OCX17881.1 hypothetical protein QV13_13115 [Mesorhizobium hungaricum]